MLKLFKKKKPDLKCVKNGKPCSCIKCEAESLRYNSLKLLEENKEITTAAKKAIHKLQRVESLLRTGEFKLMVSKKLVSSS